MCRSRFILPWALAALVACSGRLAPGAAVSVAPSAAADLGRLPPPPPPAAVVPSLSVPAVVVPMPAARRRAADDAPREPLPPWTAAPAGSPVQVFREVLVGQLPARALRKTWWLVYAGSQAYLRLEQQHSTETLPHLDRTLHFPENWSAPLRTEYVGSLPPRTAPFTLQLQRHFGTHEPATLTLHCVAKTVAVHPAFATLVEGWKNDDDSMEPGTWAPARTERVAAIACTPVGTDWPFPFASGLCFAAGKTTSKLQTAGVEWAFVNSDMVIQEGGYRFIPSFSLGTP